MTDDHCFHFKKVKKAQCLGVKAVVYKLSSCYLAEVGGKKGNPHLISPVIHHRSDACQPLDILTLHIISEIRLLNFCLLKLNFDWLCYHFYRCRFRYNLSDNLCCSNRSTLRFTNTHLFKLVTNHRDF